MPTPIIDTSFFIGDIEIPNVNQPEISDDVNNSIKLYEKEVLTDLLGYDLYKELVAHTVVTGDKFDKLINGDEFSYVLNDQTVNTKWEGLKGYEKKSLIAYYVYYMHRRKRSGYNAGVGIEVEALTENSETTSLYERMVYVWNEFVLMYGDSCQFGAYENSFPSAYNYLLNKIDDFPTWQFISQGGELNRFGL